MGKRLLLALAIVGVGAAVFLYREEIPLLRDHVAFLTWLPTHRTVIQLFGNPTNATIISGSSIAAVGGILTIAGKLKGYLATATGKLQEATSTKDQLSSQFNELKTAYSGVESKLGEAAQLKSSLESQLSTASTQLQDLTSQNCSLAKTVQDQSNELLRLKDFEVKYLEAKNRLLELTPPNLN